MLEVVTETVLAMAASPWVLLVLLLCATIDGIFPPIPSESVVIALASLSVTGDAPSLWWILPVAAVGAFAGDNLAYLIGSRLPIHKFRLFRTVRGVRALAWAERSLRRRGIVFILAARYVPIGRVAVNMTAGAVAYPYRRFVIASGVAAVMWAGYSALLGISAGALLEEHPVVAVAAGVLVSVAIGYLLDFVVRRIWRDRTAATGAPERGEPSEPPEEPAALEPLH